MTRDEALNIASECGNDNGTTLKSDLDFLVAFAQRVAAAEREACKQACEGLRGTVSMFATSKDCRLHNNAITCCVQAIRARGNA